MRWKMRTKLRKEATATEEGAKDPRRVLGAKRALQPSAGARRRGKERSEILVSVLGQYVFPTR